MMIKAIAHGADGRDILVIGLSFGNLDKFRAEPGDTYIRIDGKEMGMSMDVMIISGETEAHMAEMLQSAQEARMMHHKAMSEMRSGDAP